jgi:hypothetical protein
MGMSVWLSSINAQENTAQLGAYAVFLWRYGMNVASMATSMVPLLANSALSVGTTVTTAALSPVSTLGMYSSFVDFVGLLTQL